MGLATIYPEFAIGTVPAVGKTFLAAVDAAAQRNAIGLGTADSPTFAGGTINGPVKLEQPNIVSHQTIGSLKYIGWQGTELASIDCVRQGTANTSRLEFYTMTSDVKVLSFTTVPAGLRVGSGVFQFGTFDVVAVNPTICLQGTGATGTPQIWFSHSVAGNSGHKTKIISTGINSWYRGHFDIWLNTEPNTNHATISNLRFRINAFSGNIGIGLESPTAVCHVKAGTATANTAPLKLTAGTNLATPEAGAIEYDGTNLYFTDSGGVRRTLAVV